jgi:hypothetical protein
VYHDLSFNSTSAGRLIDPPRVLPQAEKEAKRLRRVLANRESARQTILRRQAIRDELARKVADLSSQNENMKKVKDPSFRPADRSSELRILLKFLWRPTTQWCP